MKWVAVLFGKSSNKVFTSTTTALEYCVFENSVKVSPCESEQIFVAAKLSVFRKLDDEPLPQPVMLRFPEPTRFLRQQTRHRNIAYSKFLSR